MVQTESRREQVRETFFAELDARIPALNRALLRLERSESDTATRDAAFGDLFREAHNLKAAARVVDQANIERVASAIETSIAEARGPDEPPQSPLWFDAAYALVDALATLRATSQGPSAEADSAALPPAVSQTLSPIVTQPRPAAESVRVSVDKLDALLAQAGELSVAHLRVRQRRGELTLLRDAADASRREWRNSRNLRASLRRGRRPGRQLEAVLQLVDQAEERSVVLLQHIDELSLQLGRDTAQLGLVTHAIEEEVMAVRLLPIATVSTLLERTLRDLIRSTGKQVQLIVEGGETVIDRKILEQIRDPLMHMLRNAVDHGIEPPEARLAAGKPQIGTVRLSAGVRGGFIQIEMSDDGAGLDPIQLRASVVRKGLYTADQVAAMADPAMLDVIFQPGFSTRTTVTELSGRGVGLDVVRQHVERLNGQVTVDSQLGRGTSFVLCVPLTLATTRAILLEDGGQLLALPLALVERSERVREHDIVSFEGRRAVIVEGRPIPVAELAAILRRPLVATRRPDEWRPLIILHQSERRLAILTDTLIGEQEIVVKSLGWPLRRVPNVSGAAVLGSGHTILILNSIDLLKNGSQVAQATTDASTATPHASVKRVPRLLVVDDSLTTRTLIRSILETAGYEVVVAPDGLEALTLLRSDSIDLVVTDVEMPRMDGYQLTRAIRDDERLRQISVVLVTSLASSDHRERGAAAGADAYIVKAGFVQGQLLETVARLL